VAAHAAAPRPATPPRPAAPPRPTAPHRAAAHHRGPPGATPSSVSKKPSRAPPPLRYEGFAAYATGSDGHLDYLRGSVFAGLPDIDNISHGNILGSDDNDDDDDDGKVRAHTRSLQQGRHVILIAEEPRTCAAMVVGSGMVLQGDLAVRGGQGLATASGCVQLSSLCHM
jgi:hypothetical protein